MDTGVDRNAMRPRVLAFMPEKKDITGVTFARITGPLARLREQGYPIDWIPYSQARQLATEGKGISRYDVYVFQRAGDTDGKLLTLIEFLKDAGKVVVYETDDDYTNEYRNVIDADAVSVAAESTVLTVSTPLLRTQMRKHIGDKPTYLLQNNIDLDFWDSVPYKRIVPSPSIGLVGTPTHFDDWIHAKPALFRIAEEYPGVHFVIGGMLPQYLQDLPRMTHLKPVKYYAYPAMVHQIDIGLAPLDEEDRFNWSKSAIKALEYWSSGAACIASNAPPYKRVIEHGETGFLVDNKDPDEWYRRIKDYLDNPGLRRQHAAAGREWVRKNRNMQTNAILWWAVYEESWKKYGGVINEYKLFERSVGDRPTSGEGVGSDHLPPVSSHGGKRRRRHAH